MDVEDRKPLNSARAPQNPYTVPDPPMDSVYMFRMKRVLYMSISLFGLQKFKFYGVVLRSPHVSHEWFKIGLATCIGA